VSLAVLLLGLALGAGLGAAAVLAAGWRRRALIPAPTPVIPAEPVDEPAELRRTIAENPELCALYGRIGFPPEVEQACERILGELVGMVRTEIPDFAAFRAAVAEAQQGLDSAPDAGGAFLAEDVELLREVAGAGDDPDEVLRRLDRDPVRRLLPFVERIPMTRNGERVWRSPVELSLLRKRPADPERCERLLDDLEKLVRTARLPRAEPARVEVSEALARARRDARREAAYIPTSLRSLEAAVAAWLRSASPEARRRREELDSLLLGLLRVRHAQPAPGEDPRETARAQAQLYAGAPWMQTPWLTSFALANLLDAELSALPDEERRHSTPRAAALRWVRDEVASSHFDGEETIRRLRQQEERELYVHSLVYALLRMSRLPAAQTGD
jgi:hypothetical protein